MTAPDVTLLHTTTAELKAELSRARVQAEVFRALYERQATEIDDLLAPRPGEQPSASVERHLCLVAGNDPVGLVAAAHRPLSDPPGPAGVWHVPTLGTDDSVN